MGKDIFESFFQIGIILLRIWDNFKKDPKIFSNSSVFDNLDEKNLPFKINTIRKVITDLQDGAGLRITIENNKTDEKNTLSLSSEDVYYLDNENKNGKTYSISLSGIKEIILISFLLQLELIFNKFILPIKKISNQTDSKMSLKSEIIEHIKNSDSIYENELAEIIPPIDNKRLFYVLRLLSDTNLRKFLSLNGKFPVFYDCIANNIYDEFIKKANTDDFNPVFSQYAQGILIEELSENIQNYIELYINDNSEKSILIFLPPYKRIVDLYDYIEKAFNGDNFNLSIEDILLMINELADNLKELIPLTQYVINNSNITPFIKNLTKLETRKALKLLNKENLIELTDKNKDITSYISSITPDILYEIMLFHVNKEVENADDINLKRLDQFINENFNIFPGNEKRVESYLNNIKLWIDSIKESKWFYALIFLLFPRVMNQNSGLDELRDYERFNTKMLSWKSVPSSQDEAVTRFIKFFPQFSNLVFPDSYGAKPNKQKKALSELVSKSKEKWGWIENWEKEVWNANILSLIFNNKRG